MKKRQRKTLVVAKKNKPRIFLLYFDFFPKVFVPVHWAAVEMY